MHPVLFNESFSFCSRDDLERLQPVSQSLLDIVVAGSNVLPLRPIHCVKMGSDDSEDSFQIFVAGPVDGADADESEPDYTASIPDGDFTENFRRLQNTCIKYFCVGVRESPFLRYWKAQEAAAFVVVSIAVDLPEAADYGVLDSIVSLLRPKSTEISIEESSWDENDHNDVYKKYLGLLARESYLNNLQTCHLQVRGDAFPSPTFFLQERGYSNYELWCIDSNVADRIDGFIESFVREGCANEKLQSVCIGWYHTDGRQPPTPKQLSKPIKIDVPLPKNYLTALLARYDLEVTQCETQFFDNTMQWKRVELYKWTVKYDRGDRRRTAPIFQCLVKHL